MRIDCEVAKLGSRCGKGIIRKKDCRKNIIILCEGQGNNFPPLIGRQHFLVEVTNGCYSQILRVVDKTHDTLYINCLDNKKVCEGDTVVYTESITECTAQPIINTTCNPCNSCEEKKIKRTPLRNFLERITRGRD